jgi:hypothetical protein
MNGGFVMFVAAAVAVVYILGLWWCYEVVRRFPDDLREISELKDTTRTLAIIFVWIITVPLAFGLVIYGLVLVRRLIWFVGTL